MNIKTLLFLLSGVIIIIIAFLYFLTRPSLFNAWDFSSTGQIGDTIGGITAPFLSLLGASLVYLSFQTQIEANKIQIKALNDEKLQNIKTNQFDHYLLSFEEIRKSLISVEFIVEHPARYIGEGTYSPPEFVTYHGLNALNEFVLRLEDSSQFHRQKYDTFGLEVTFKYILKAIFDLIERIEKKINDQEDKDFLLQEIALYYNGFLKIFAERILACKIKPGDSLLELQEIKNKIEKKIGS